MQILPDRRLAESPAGADWGFVKTFIYSRKLQARGFCRSCSCERELSRRVADHRLHLILTILTLGLWGIAWISIWCGEQRRPWRCRICRRPVLRRSAPEESAASILAVSEPDSAGFLPAPRASPRTR